METNKKLLIVGDLHGKIELAKTSVAKAKELGADIIFIGDLTDSFKMTNAEQLQTLVFVADLCEKGQARCVWGNHDLSYLFPQWFRCSGFSETKRQLFSAAYQKLWSSGNFVPFIAFPFGEKRLLVSHAGLAPKHVPAFETDPIAFLNRELSGDIRAIPNSPLLQAGFDSGSYNQACGGITWLRPSEFSEGFTDIVQVVGHTPQKHIQRYGKLNMICIDCLEYGYTEVLLVDLDTLEMKEVSLTP